VSTNQTRKIADLIRYGKKIQVVYQQDGVIVAAYQRTAAGIRGGTRLLRIGVARIRIRTKPPKADAVGSPNHPQTRLKSQI